MKHFLRIILFGGLGLLLGGCCACHRYQKQTQRPLAGTDWQLIQLGGRNVAPEAGKFTIRFAADGVLSGVGSCNRLTGRYEVQGDRALKIAPVGTTMMMCPSGMETERALALALEEADHYDMDGPMLLLLTDGELRAVFQAQLAPERSQTEAKQ